MPMTPPSSANNPAKRWAFYSRAWKLLGNQSRAYSASHTTEEFHAWERAVWIPRLKALSVYRNAAQQERLEELLSRVPTIAEDAVMEAMASGKAQGEDDASWDADIDLETLNGG